LPLALGYCLFVLPVHRDTFPIYPRH
jgi:hypothetical protein